MITVENLTKVYRNGEIETHVLRGISLSINSGEFVAIMGKSGAGKSTLLYQLGLLDTPTSGVVTIDGIDVTHASESVRSALRLSHLGYVFQDYALVPDLDAVHNVMIPLLMRGMPRSQAYQQSQQTLASLDLSHRMNNYPQQMSGGEQQRVSIARALAHTPKVLFADEPTANLDSGSSEQVIQILSDLHKQGQTIVMVTHEKEYTASCDRVITIHDGQVVN